MDLKESRLATTQQSIALECDAIKELLLAKNREYGNSALEPLGVFSHLDAVGQIEVRIDDKLKRLQTTRRMSKDGEEISIHEDTEQDLIGYLILLRVARRASLTCEICQGRFEEALQYKMHIEDVHDGTCPKSRALAADRELLVAKALEQPVTCDQCDKIFEGARALRDHLVRRPSGGLLCPTDLPSENPSEEAIEEVSRC